MNQPTKQTLRKTLRLRRLQLSSSAQQEKALQLANILITLPEFLFSQHIAVYWPNDGEISPLPLVKLADSLGKQCYLPMLDPINTQHLLFADYRVGDPLLPNRFGILEPKWDKKTIPAWALNIVFAPLVGFDDKGRRLGMGKGYYDRTFSFMNKDLGNRPRNPKLVGLAYECQHVAELPKDAWDIPLTGIATEQRYISI